MPSNHNMFIFEEERLALCPPLWDQDQLKARRFYRLDDSFSGFAGHFPDYAVLPALAQMSFMRMLAEKCLGHALCCRKIKNAKFMGQGQIGDFLRLEVAVAHSNGMVELDGKAFCLKKHDLEPLAAPESSWEQICLVRMTCAMRECTNTKKECANARDAF